MFNRRHTCNTRLIWKIKKFHRWYTVYKYIHVNVVYYVWAMYGKIKKFNYLDISSTCSFVRTCTRVVPSVCMYFIMRIHVLITLIPSAAIAIFHSLINRFKPFLFQPHLQCLTVCSNISHSTFHQ